MEPRLKVAWPALHTRPPHVVPSRLLAAWVMTQPPCPSGSQAEFSPTTQHPAQVPRDRHIPQLSPPLRAKEALVSAENLDTT